MQQFVDSFLFILVGVIIVFVTEAAKGTIAAAENFRFVILRISDGRPGISLVVLLRGGGGQVDHIFVRQGQRVCAQHHGFRQMDSGILVRGLDMDSLGKVQIHFNFKLLHSSDLLCHL